MLLIQLYPFTYLDSSNNNLLLYNTLNNKFKFIKNNVSIHVENRTSLILDENTINSNIASEIAQEQYGYIHFTQSLSNNKIMDYYSVLTKYYNDYTTQEWDNKFIVENYIDKIVLNISESIDLFTGSIQRPTTFHQIINKHTINEVGSHISNFKKLTKLSINTDYKALIVCINEINKLTKKCYNIELNIPFSDFQLQQENILKLFNGKINLIINNLNHNIKDDLFYHIDKNNNVYFKVVISSEFELNLLESWGLLNNSKLSLEIASNQKEDKLQDLLCYDFSEIINSKQSVEQIIRKENINTLYWGELFIKSNGNLMSNPIFSIGNINDWSNINFGLLLSETSIWRSTRNRFVPCRWCVLRNICPPVSLIELLSQKQFCKINRQNYSFI